MCTRPFLGFPAHLALIENTRTLQKKRRMRTTSEKGFGEGGRILTIASFSQPVLANRQMEGFAARKIANTIRIQCCFYKGLLDLLASHVCYPPKGRSRQNHPIGSTVQQSLILEQTFPVPPGWKESHTSQTMVDCYNNCCIWNESP